MSNRRKALSPLGTPSLRLGEESIWRYPVSDEGKQIRDDYAARRVAKTPPTQKGTDRRASDQSIDLRQDAVDARKRLAARNVIMRRLGKEV